MMWWRKWRKKRHNPELDRATKKVDDISKRADKIVRDNHLVIDIKKALGAG